MEMLTCMVVPVFACKSIIASATRASTFSGSSCKYKFILLEIVAFNTFTLY